MQNAATDGALARFESRNEAYGSIVSDLVSLMAHVQASMKLLELAIAGESCPGDQDVAANVVVLDDVTPRYEKASAALNSCNAGLGVALHFLQDTSSVNHAVGGCAQGGRQPVRLIAHA